MISLGFGRGSVEWRVAGEPRRWRRRRRQLGSATDNGRAPKLLPNLGRVNHLSAVSRAREGRGHHELASRASRRCRAERHARGESNSRPVDLFRLFYFVCSFSVGRCRLIARERQPADHLRFRKFGSRRVMDSISRPAVVWWWSRASYGVSPTTPPIETAPTIGLWRVLSLRHFRPARSGSYRLAREHRAARRSAERPPTRTCGGRRRRRFAFSPSDRGARRWISAGRGDYR